MPRPGGGAIREFRMLFNLGRIADLTDGELLDRYLSREGEPSELAFAALVERHGPMVLRTCRAVLRDEHESRDAFQATFQVLLRKARSLRVRDSLGPWLHQVALRTARCSRARAHRRRQAEAVAAEASASKAPADLVDRHDLGEVLHLELARLPDRQRSAVVLCCLEGLSLDQAARRLGWPLGTVQSRLARGRKTLRDRLARRGVAPSAGAFASLLAAERAGAAVPVALAEATVVAAGHLPAGSSAAGIVPAAVLALTEGVLRSMFLTKLKLGTAALVVVGGGSWAGASLLALGPPGGAPANPAAPPAVALSRPDKPEPPPPPEATAPDEKPKPEPSLAEQYAALLAEYDAKMEAMREAQQDVTDREELTRIYVELSPSLTDYARRMVDLAETDPTSEAARDALLWVIDQPSSSDGGTYGDQFARASALLVRHHSHAPDAVRIGLRLSNFLSFRRDALLLGLVASAEGREAEGLARMALAQYLRLKAGAAEGARKTEDRADVHILGRGEDGRTTSRVVKQSDDEFAYRLHLRQCDSEFLQAEAERLFEEVLADYADVPYLTRRIQTWSEELARRGESGEPITEEEQQRLDSLRSKTLGSVAAEQLDEIRNVSPGKVAPEIAGDTLDGDPMALSDHRGKVVLLVFWGATGRPEAVTHLVADLGGLPDRFEGRPFAMLGVNCDPNPEDAAHAIETGPIPWPNWSDPAPEDGPLARLYHVDRFPTLFLIDADGILRHRLPRSFPEDRLAQAIEALLEEARAESDDAPDRQ